MNYSVPVRRVFLGMVALGFASLVFGWKTDVSTGDWSTSLGFLTNIWAGFTGFLIGVPVALVVLSTVTRQSEDKAASDRVQNLTRVAWNQFRDAVEDLCSENRTTTMESIAKTIKAYHDQTFKGFENYESSNKTTQDYAGLQAFIKQQIRQWQDPFAQMMRGVGTSQDLGMVWYAILRDWNTLDQYVRLQRLERDLKPPWFDRILDSQLQERMKPDAHPMNPLFEKHEGPRAEYNDWRQYSMWAAFNSLYQFVDLPHDHYAERKVLCTSYFPNNPVEGYLEAVEKASLNMRQLLIAVEQIDQGDWLGDTR
jgi:hypothetical protein